METIKDLAYWKNNCEENYLTTPISVLRYITELEKSIQLMQTAVAGQSEQLTCDCGKLPDEKYDPCCSLECWHEMFT
jgi:hypothetical protein